MGIAQETATMKTSASAASASASAASNNNEVITTTKGNAIMSNSENTIAAAVAIATAQAPIADLNEAKAAVSELVKQNHSFRLGAVAAVFARMTSIRLTDYLAVFYTATEVAVEAGQIENVVKLLLDKGGARFWTEHNNKHAQLSTEELKLASIREMLKYWSVGVLTVSAYDAATKPAPEPKAAKAPRATGVGSNNVLKTLAERITTMSNSVDVAIDDRVAYAKIANALTLTNGRAMYDTLMSLPKAAAIIVAAESAIVADKATAAAQAAATAQAEAEAMAMELTSLFG